MGPKLLKCCRPEQVGTKEHGKHLKIIQVLEDGRVLAKEGGNSTQKENHEKRASEAFEQVRDGRFHDTKKGWWNLARNKVLQDRGSLPQEEGDTIRE